MNKKSSLNKFLILLENDFYRNLKVVLPMIALFLICNIVMSFMYIRGVLSNIERNLTPEKVGMVSFNTMLNETGILYVMLLSFGAIALYTLVIWNREWTGASRSCYTLLTLPFQRSYALISKTIVIFIFLGINMVIQIGGMFIYNGLLASMVDGRFIKKMSVLGTLMGTSIEGRYNSIRTFTYLDGVTLVLNFLLALSLVALITLAILLFRSFKVKGGILGTVNFILYILVYLFLPGVLYFYFIEKVYFKVGFPLIVSGIGFLWSGYLLNRKVCL